MQTETPQPKPRRLQLLAAVPRTLLLELGIAVAGETNLFLNAGGKSLEEVDRERPEWLQRFEDAMVWRTREQLETDDTLVHFIPYLLIHDGHGKVFHYQRTSKVGESKLAGNRSIGIGGHMDVTAQVARYVYTPYYDSPVSHFLTAVNAGLSAELYEEVGAHQVDDVGRTLELPQFCGFYYDDTDANDGVGKVHLALIFTMRLKDDQTVGDAPLDLKRFYTKETELVTLAPLDLTTDLGVQNYETDLEPWSDAMVEYAAILGLK